MNLKNELAIHQEDKTGLRSTNYSATCAADNAENTENNQVGAALLDKLCNDTDSK